MYEQIIEKNIFPNNGQIKGYRPSEPVLSLMKKILVIDQRNRMGWEELISQDIFNVSKDLPQKYRMTTNIGHLKNLNLAAVESRKEEDVINELKPEESLVKDNGVKVSRLRNEEKEKLMGRIDRTEEEILKWARETHLECLKTEFILKDIITPI